MTTSVSTSSSWAPRFGSSLLGSLLAGGLSLLAFSLISTHAGRFFPLVPLAGLALLLAGVSARQAFKCFQTATTDLRQGGSALALLLSALSCVAALGASAGLVFQHYVGFAIGQG